MKVQNEVIQSPSTKAIKLKLDQCQTLNIRLKSASRPTKCNLKRKEKKITTCGGGMVAFQLGLPSKI